MELLNNGHDVTVRFPDGYQEAPLAYDAVWAVALGMSRLTCICTQHTLFTLHFNFPFVSVSVFYFVGVQFFIMSWVHCLVDFFTNIYANPCMKVSQVEFTRYFCHICIIVIILTWRIYYLR